MKIPIRKSPTANNKDWSKIPEEEVFDSTISHIADVACVLENIVEELRARAIKHDHTKAEYRQKFYKAFQNRFQNDDEWWTFHKETERHHLDESFDDIDLIDVLEHLADGLAASCARRGKDDVYPPRIDPILLEKAMLNTFYKLLESVEIIDE